MKNIIYLNYGINADLKEYYKDIYYFYIDYIKYYFIKVDRPLKDILNINNYLVENNYYHSIIRTNDNKFHSKIGKKHFVLLKLNLPENNEITIEEILKYQVSINDYNPDLDRRSWSNLWERKVDYLEYQISEFAINHKSAINSFSYYVSLAENAIEYFNLTPKDGIVSLNQKRIIYPNYARDFLNPLNLIIDYRVRDIAEYIKSSFWNGINALNELKKVLEKNLYSSSEYNLLFVRILYPSNYFDDLQGVLEKNKDDDILIKYVERAEEYRLFIRDVFFLITKKAPLMSIDWIIKEH